MKCSEICALIEQEYGTEYACDWDNVGLLAGRSTKEVKKILLSLDATDEVVRMAAEGGYDMLITHHPMLFSAIKRVTDQDMNGRRLLELIRNDISYYAMHTNYDTRGMADLAARTDRVCSIGRSERWGRHRKSRKTASSYDPSGVWRAGESGIWHSKCQTVWRFGYTGKPGGDLPRGWKKYYAVGIRLWMRRLYYRRH